MSEHKPVPPAILNGLPPGFRRPTAVELKKMRPLIEKKIAEIEARTSGKEYKERLLSRDPMRRPYLEVGTEISCPNAHCQHSIARVVKRLNFDEAITSAHFQGDSISYGAETKCPKCGMPWCLPDDNYRIHTRQGWFPPTV